MAGIITISPGHDASYPWRQIGTTTEASQATRAGVGYYLSPAGKGGEPPGRWHGGGLGELGFTDGQVIDRGVFERLYGHFADPRAAGETLGRAPQRFRSADEVFAVLAALEPSATAERRAELMTQARCQVRMPVQYFDATFSVSKSVSLLHASAMASAAAAARRGDAAAARYFEQAAGTVWAAIWAGNAAALEYLQAEAGYTRSGYHGRQVTGVSTGRWEDAHGFIVGSFAQHTSRDGDPQLHIHNLILNRVRRERDGAWRTLDSRALHEYRGAAAAIATLVTESALTRELGVGWTGRADGYGREVAGVSQALMDRFSSRRQSICALTGRLAAEFEAQHGYAPDARALGRLRQWANHATRAAKPGEPLDLAAEVRRWAAQARASEAGALEPVLATVSAVAGAGGGAAGTVGWLSPEQERELMAQALARVQQAQPTWRRADLIRHLGELLPDHFACADDAAAARLLPELADQALAGGAGEEVLALEAPEWPPVPQPLRRADGRSVYRPHGGTRYATLAQLTLEERLVAQARQAGAPKVAPELAARLLGAAQEQLEAQLQEQAQLAGAGEQTTGSGLRLDQAAAAYVAVTSDRRAEILVGPAGSGKTRTAGVIARLWQQAGLGPVYGLTTSQAARNVLHEAGVQLADNTAMFLRRLQASQPGGGDVVRPGALLLLDEASMMPMTELAVILDLAAARGCRVLITGDHEQLAAVQGGGGMLMLARRLGYVQLAEPVRFACEWERDASLRLRAGDATVAGVYDEQGRLRGGDAEEAMELACRGWLTDFLVGRDALLMARTEEQARELSRRIRDELRHYGIVHRAGTQARLRYGAAASAGDLIVARHNDRRIIAGEPGRWLTNRDVLRVERVLGRSVIVRRRLAGRDGGGQPGWSAPFELPWSYLTANCDLAYATTTHAAQGRTVETGHLLVDGVIDRQGTYVGLSRGWRANYAYCVTGPHLADPAPGSRPAPELGRARQRALERSGLAPPGTPVPDEDAQAGTARLHPVAVLAQAIGRDGAVTSATKTLRAGLSDADHLGVLGSIWYDLTRREQAARFERLLRQHLTPADADAALADPACTWLWRTLREAEAGGMDAGTVLQSAIAARSLRGAMHVARVIDARIRRAIQDVVPRPRGSWAGQVPQASDLEIGQYLTELARAMDDRVSRIGEHVARTRPAWATHALGEPPDDAAQRADWAARAGQIGAYREMYGYSSLADAIGPEPGRVSPEARADWQTSFAALGHIDGTDLRGCTDGQLHLHRNTYQRETSWAPPYVADQLRLARLQARTAWENHIRAEREHRSATDLQAALRHRQLAAAWSDMHTTAVQVADSLAQAQETRRQWEILTESARHLALAADQELHRRHPGRFLEPLRSAEPGDFPEPSPDDDQARHQGSSPAGPGPAGGSDQPALAVLGDSAWEDIQQRVEHISQQARAAQERIDEMHHARIASGTDGAADPGPAWNALLGRHRDAIIQTPQPDIAPASEILRRADERIAAVPEAENA